MTELPPLLPSIVVSGDEPSDVYQFRMNIVDKLRSNPNITWDARTIDTISRIIVNKVLYNAVYDPYIESLIPVIINLLIS